ncbi:Fibropellin-1 [Diplonema papillatum]|nr:Fibropellin-1 [Diplonema papillatum]
MWEARLLLCCWLVHAAEAAFAADGCTAGGEAQEVVEARLAAVRCCHDAGFCYSHTRGRCHAGSASFERAREFCEGQSSRLCTLAELNTGFCCGTGCGFDDRNVWIDNCATQPCVHGTCTRSALSYTCTCDEGYIGANCDVPRAFAADGCVLHTVYNYWDVSTVMQFALALIRAQDFPGDNDQDMVLDSPRLSELAAVRCCRPNARGNNYINGECYASVNFTHAESLCESVSSRLCAWQELRSGIACSQGCYFDTAAVWVDNCATRPCVYGTCKSTAESYTCTCDEGYVGENCGGEGYAVDGCTMNDPHNWLYSYYVHTYGYVSYGAADLDGDSVPGWPQATWEAAVRCCGDGSFCRSEIGGRCYGAASIHEARGLCEGVSARLCTWAEVRGGECCWGACGFDYAAVWIDNCAERPCGHGTCKPTADSYTCACDDGYSGRTCGVKLPVPALAVPDECAHGPPAPRTAPAAVRCCHADGRCTCEGTRKTFDEARAACAALPAARLCTAGQLEAGACCSAGCGGGSDAVWLDNCAEGRCAHGTCTPTARSYTCECFDGYGGADCDTQLPQQTEAPNPTPLPSPIPVDLPPPSLAASGACGEPVAAELTPFAAVRCCSRDGGWCAGGCYGRGEESFQQARSICAQHAARLCTLGELRSACCPAAAACGGGGAPVWFDNCAAAPCAHGVCTPASGSHYDCACDAGYYGEHCDSAVPGALSRPAASPLLAGSHGQVPPSSTAADMFGAHSFDVLSEAVDRVKASMRDRAARLAVDAMDALGLNDAAEQIAGENGFAENIEEMARAAVTDIFGSLLNRTEPLKVDLDDVMDAAMEKVSSFIETCPSSVPQQQRLAVLQGFTETIQDIVTEVPVSAGLSLSFPVISKQSGSWRKSAGLGVDLGHNKEQFTYGVGGKLDVFFSAKKPDAQALALKVSAGVKISFLNKATRASVSLKMKLFPWTPMADWGNTTGRSMLPASLDEHLEAAKGLAKGVATGEYVTAFCFGDCADTRRSFSGTAALSAPECGGMQFRARSQSLTLGGLAYVLSGNDLQPALEAVRIDGLGLSDVDVTMKVSPGGSVVFNAIGAPSYDSDTLSFLGTDLLLGVTIEKQPMYKRLRLTAGMSADDSENMFRIRDAAGQLGLSVHVQFEKWQQTTSKEFKVTLPVAVCIENCDEGDARPRRDLFFAGELGIEFHPTGPPQASGDITAAGFWYNAFGQPFLHIGDMILGLSVDLGSLQPSRLTIGGAVCLGTASNCERRVEPFVEARCYIGTSWKTTQDNFFIAMVTRLSFNDIFDVFSEFAPSLSNVKPLLSAELLRTGIYPFDDSECVYPNAGLDMNCYAVLSFAFIDKELSFSPGNVVQIPSGVQLRGRLNLAGWEIQVYFKVDERSLEANVRMDPVVVTIGSFDLLKIGERLDTNGHVVGGARFYMALIAFPPQAAIDVSGALEIPLIGASGDVAIKLNGDEFSFEASLSLFGGFLTASAHASWDWGFTSFQMGLDDISFGVVSLEELSFGFGTEGVFKGKITVLAIAGVGAEVVVRRSIDAFILSFSVSSTVLGATVTVSGTGEVRSPLSDSEWDLSVSASFDFGGLVEEVVKGAIVIAEQAQKAWDAAKEFSNKAVAWVADHVVDLGVGFFSTGANFLSLLVGSLAKLFDGAEKLFRGDFTGFLSTLGELAKSIFPSTVKHHVFTPLSSKDEYNCPYLQESWSVETCYVFFCDSDYFSRRVRNKACLEKRARSLVRAAEVAQDVDEVDVELATSQEQNRGYTALLLGARVPPPRISRADARLRTAGGGSLPSATVDATFAVALRSLAGAGGGFLDDAETAFSVETRLDYGTPRAFKASLGPLVQRVTDSLLKNQPGVSLRKAAQMGARLPPSQASRAGAALEAEVRPPVLGAASFFEETCVDEEDAGSAETFGASAPALVYTDSACKRAVVELIADELLAGPPPDAGSRICGTQFVQLSWQARYGADCRRLTSGVVTQIAAATPPPIRLTRAPGPVAVAVSEFERPSRTSTWFPKWHTGCYMSMNIAWDDVFVATPSCGRQRVQRTWTAKLDLGEIDVATLRCIPPPANTYVQMITVVNASAAC